MAPVLHTLTQHNDGIHRCPWCGIDPIYMHYHDTEWGVPEYDSRALFEKLVLDSFQSGLSWITILKKRDNFRTAFDGFDVEKIARYDEADFERLMNDAGIVRNRLKIRATIENAKAFLQLQEQQEFSAYLWQFVGGAPIINTLHTMAYNMPHTPLSKAIAKDLAQRGFKFCGPTVVYAFMQAVGIVNDHLVGCGFRGVD